MKQYRLVNDVVVVVAVVLTACAAGAKTHAVQVEQSCCAIGTAAIQGEH